MKLKPIPNNTVVHTPTEAEAKELFAILQENGYKWGDGDDLDGEFEDNRRDKTYSLTPTPVVFTTPYSTGAMDFAEFKRLYCEEEKPRETDIDGKFHINDKVITTTYCPLYGKGWVGTVVQCYESDVDVAFGLRVIPHIALCDLETYTEPETKPTEDMEAKEKEQSETGNNSENSLLNLCELLKGHEGEVLYSPIVGDCTLTAVKDYIYVSVKDHPSYCFFPDGRREPSGDVVLFPSRALYEQYPLDAAKAWRIWDEKHYIHRLAVRLYSDDEIKKVLAAEGKENVSGLLSCICRFKTLADRDKCVEEIKAVIEKYNK